MRAFPGINARNLQRLESDSWTSVLRKRVTLLAAHATEIRQEVDAYLAPVFSRFSFTVSPEFQRPGTPDNQRITDERYLYLADLTSPKVAAYYDARDQAHRAHGYHLTPGQCPALMAENASIGAENDLLEHGERYMGIPFREARSDLRDQALAIFMRPFGVIVTYLQI